METTNFESKVQISCPECEADYAIAHNLDDNLYPVTNCQFCLAPLDADTIENLTYDHDEEMWVPKE